MIQVGTYFACICVHICVHMIVEINLDLKMSELSKALKKCKNTAPGKDMLSYEMFRNLSSLGKEFLLRFFNIIWQKGLVPCSWRHGIVVPILKPNKSRCDPVSYRPITLTSNLCKLMERIITSRLTWYLHTTWYGRRESSLNLIN